MIDLNEVMGEFTYCGIQYGLEQCINPAAHQTNEIDLQFHCDGLSVSKSSNSEVWPILCRVYSKVADYQPFVVAMFHGKSKPMDVNDYLTEFVLELNNLLEHGITVEGRQFQIYVQCIIADTPARAFLKCIQGHTGAYVCERCPAIGVSLNDTDNTREQQEDGEDPRSQRTAGRRRVRQKRRRIVFPNVSEEPRTDQSFRSFRDYQHHKGPSLLRDIEPPINMVLMLVLDFMHLGYLGIMKKLLEYWFSVSSRFKVAQREKAELTRRLEQIKNQIPQEFARKIRAINNWAKYKATECKFFALYIGPIVLKRIIPNDQYQHFLSFQYASRVLWSERTARNTVHLSRRLLENFFLQCKQIYGQTSASINMHNLNHVVDDVEFTHLSLSYINAFAYKNYLGIIKRKLRSPYRLLAQICRRNHEATNLNTKAKLIPEIEIQRGPGHVIKKIRYKGNYFTAKRPDNTILLDNNLIMEIQRIYQEGNNIVMQGPQWTPRSPIYANDSINSVNQNMFELNNEPSPEDFRWNLNRVKNKLVRIDVDLEEDGEIKKYVIPMLHE